MNQQEKLNPEEERQIEAYFNQIWSAHSREEQEEPEERKVLCFYVEAVRLEGGIQL